MTSCISCKVLRNLSPVLPVVRKFIGQGERDYFFFFRKSASREIKGRGGGVFPVQPPARIKSAKNGYCCWKHCFA